MNMPYPAYQFLSTPSVRRATWRFLWSWILKLFLSTPSVRRATTFSLQDYKETVAISIHALRAEGDAGPARGFARWHKISIHALRAEGDNIVNRVHVYIPNFYPRPPCGGRLIREFGRNYL